MEHENTILYVCWGAGAWLEQLTFSVLSALHHLAAANDEVRIVVYCDRPVLGDLPIELRLIDVSKWQEWSGTLGSTFRPKIFALKDSLDRYAAPVLYVDCDTYFRESPRCLFDRVKPGHSFLHIRENALSKVTTSVSAHAGIIGLFQSHALHARNGAVLDANGLSMWNCGVIALDPADAHILDEVIHTSDEVAARGFAYYAEQIAFSYWLPRLTCCREARGTIFHYWRAYLRDDFTKRLSRIVPQSEQLPVRTRAAVLYRQRPKPPLRRRFVRIGKEILHRLGFEGAGARSDC